MLDSEYFRDEARRCRELARTAKMIDTARRWVELADEYDQLAVSLERRSNPPPLQRAPMQQQPVQQQSKTTGDE